MFRAKLIIVSITGLLAVGAINSASASAAIHWFPCQRETGLIWHWTTYFCFPAAVPANTGEFELLLRPVGTKLNITTGGGLFTISSTVAGIKLTADCSKEKGTGWIENPTSGNGIDLETLEFKECIVSKPEGQHCAVTEPVTAKVSTELQNLEEKVWDLFSPDPAGESFTKLTLSGCASEVLDGTYSITGKTAALIEQTTSTLKFGKAFSELKLAGSSATLEGSTVALSDAGGGIQAL
jgi:hypothetical protein